jgi:hypothetical protein
MERPLSLDKRKWTLVPPGVPVNLRDKGLASRLEFGLSFPTCMEVVMTAFPESPADAALRQLAEQFTHWRQSRRTSRGPRIPEALWTEAVRLVQFLPLTHIAKELRLKPQALKRHQATLRSTPALTPPSQAPRFVEVTAAWRPPTTEVEIQRSDGTRLRILYSETAPALVPLLQTFLEGR